MNARRQKTRDASDELGRRLTLRAIVSEALRLIGDGDYPMVRYDLAHAYTVLEYPSDGEAAIALGRQEARL